MVEARMSVYGVAVLLLVPVGLGVIVIVIGFFFAVLVVLRVVLVRALLFFVGVCFVVGLTEAVTVRKVLAEVSVAVHTATPLGDVIFLFFPAAVLVDAAFLFFSAADDSDITLYLVSLILILCLFVLVLFDLSAGKASLCFSWRSQY